MQSFKEHKTEIQETIQLEENWMTAWNVIKTMTGSASKGLSDMAKKKSGQWTLKFVGAVGLGGLTIAGFFNAIKFGIEKGKEAFVEIATDPKAAAFIVILVTLGVTASNLPRIIQALKGARNDEDVIVILQREGVDIPENDEIVIDDQDVRNAAREVRKLL